MSATCFIQLAAQADIRTVLEGRVQGKGRVRPREMLLSWSLKRKQGNVD